jgi:integrase
MGRYVRNAGVRNLYKRGKVFYRVTLGKWESLHTSFKREAIARLREAEERDIAKKFLKQAGLEDVAAKLGRVEEKLEKIAAQPEQVATQQPEQKSLAPSIAKVERGDFVAASKAFLKQIPSSSKKTAGMWKTCNNALVGILQGATEFAEQDLKGMDLWEKFERITPSGVWNLYKDGAVGAPAPDQPLLHRKRAGKGAGNSSLNHLSAYLRKLVPYFAEMDFLPKHFIKNAEGIPKQEVHKRNPRIPTPDEMDHLAKEWESQDPKSAELLQFLRYSGARIAAALDKIKGLRWGMVDLDNRDFVLHQKGDKRHRVPIGPQLVALLRNMKKRAGGDTNALVFDFTSTDEDRAQFIMKAAAKKVGGNVVDMTHFHALKHYFKSVHQAAGTSDRTSDLLTFNKPAERSGSGDVYRHADYELMRQAVEKVRL